MKSPSAHEHVRAGRHRRGDQPGEHRRRRAHRHVPGVDARQPGEASAEAPTERSQPSNPVRPWRHSSAAAARASNAVRGGRPYVAVFRYVASGEKGWRARRSPWPGSVPDAAPAQQRRGHAADPARNSAVAKRVAPSASGGSRSAMRGAELDPDGDHRVRE